jgi:hypothetical protein
VTRLLGFNQPRHIPTQRDVDSDMQAHRRLQEPILHVCCDGKDYSGKTKRLGCNKPPHVDSCICDGPPLLDTLAKRPKEVYHDRPSVPCRFSSRMKVRDIHKIETSLLKPWPVQGFPADATARAVKLLPLYHFSHCCEISTIRVHGISKNQAFARTPFRVFLPWGLAPDRAIGKVDARPSWVALPRGDSHVESSSLNWCPACLAEKGQHFGETER